MLLKLLAHADTGIRTGEFNLCSLRIRTRLFAASQPDFAPCVVVLDRIADDIHQQPTQVQRTAEQAAVLNRIAIRYYRNAPLPRLLIHHHANTVQQFLEVKLAFLQHDLAGFQLAHVQHLIYQLEQQTGGIPYFLPALGLLVRIVLVVIRNLNHTANAVDRRADIVAHALQELGLSAVGLLGLFSGFHQLLTEFPLAPIPLGQIFPRGTSAEHLNRGQHDQINDQRRHHIFDHISHYHAVGYIGVDIVVAAAVQTAEIGAAIALEMPDRGGRKIRLDLLQNTAALHLGISQRFIVGRDNAVTICHHNHTVVPGIIARKRALYGQRIIACILRSGVIVCNDHTGHICTAVRRNIHIGAVRQVNPRSIGLLRIPDHIEHCIPLYILLQCQKIQQITVILALHASTCVQQNNAGQPLFLRIETKPFFIYSRAFIADIAVYLLCVVHDTHQTFGNRCSIVACIGRALLLYIIYRIAELFPCLRALRTHRVKADHDNQHGADCSRNPFVPARGFVLFNLQHSPPPNICPDRTDTCL